MDRHLQAFAFLCATVLTPQTPNAQLCPVATWAVPPQCRWAPWPQCACSCRPPLLSLHPLLPPPHRPACLPWPSARPWPGSSAGPPEDTSGGGFLKMSLLTETDDWHWPTFKNPPQGTQLKAFSIVEQHLIVIVPRWRSNRLLEKLSQQHITE